MVTMTTGADVIALDANTGAQLWQVKPAVARFADHCFRFAVRDDAGQPDLCARLTDGAVQWQQSGSATQAGVFGVRRLPQGRPVIAGYSSGELIAHRYENGRTLWADALARTSISTSVSSLTDIDADPIIDNGRVYALGQGGRRLTSWLPDSVSGNSASQGSPPGYRGRVDFCPDRRCPPAGHRTAPARSAGHNGAISRPGGQERSDFLDRPVPAMNNPGRQQRRRDLREHGRGIRQPVLRPRRAGQPGRGEQHALHPRRQRTVTASARLCAISSGVNHSRRRRGNDMRIDPDDAAEERCFCGCRAGRSAGLFAWVLFARAYAISTSLDLPGPREVMSGPHAALVGLLAAALPMALWSVVVEKVHRRPSTSLDWSLAARASPTRIR